MKVLHARSQYFCKDPDGKDAALHTLETVFNDDQDHILALISYVRAAWDSGQYVLTTVYLLRAVLAGDGQLARNEHNAVLMMRQHVKESRRMFGQLMDGYDRECMPLFIDEAQNQSIDTPNMLAYFGRVARDNGNCWLHTLASMCRARCLSAVRCGACCAL